MHVKTICLGILADRPLSGYEIRKELEESFRHFFLAGFGSIYPALAELARDGLLTVESVEQAKRPDKKLYRITGAGRARLAHDLLAAEPRHRVRSEFLALVYFAHLLPPERVAEVLETMTLRIERTVEAELAALSDCSMTPGQRFALGYGRTVLAAALDYLRAQRPQLLRELATEAGRLPAAAE